MATILIVDDDQMTQILMRSMLTKAGLDVAGATSYEEGLQMASAFIPDLILMDIQLPGRQGNGWSAAKSIRSDPALQHIPIIVITAGGMAKQPLEADDYDGFFQKPFRAPELLDTIFIHLKE